MTKGLMNSNEWTKGKDVANMTDNNKDCLHCVAYNVDHCTATKCQGAITVFAHRQPHSRAKPIRKLSDEELGKYYDFFFSSFQEGFEQVTEQHSGVCDR